MNAFFLWFRRLLLTSLAAVALLVAPTALVTANAAPTGGCYNGVLPLAPYVQSCSLPSAHPHVPGSAPDAAAIIACRDHPGCLSWYVNGR
jgi:hypothetical protein